MKEERKEIKLEIRKDRWHRYLQVLAVLAYLAKQNGKNYCYPSQEKILQLLEQKYGVKYSRSHLNRILNLLEYLKFFKRVRRHRRGAGGGIVFNSTLYLLTSKAFKIIGKFAFYLKDFVLSSKEKVKAAVENVKQAFDPLAITPEMKAKAAERFRKIREMLEMKSLKPNGMKA